MENGNWFKSTKTKVKVKVGEIWKLFEFKKQAREEGIWKKSEERERERERKREREREREKVGGMVGRRNRREMREKKI